MYHSLPIDQWKVWWRRKNYTQLLDKVERSVISESDILKIALHPNELGAKSVERQFRKPAWPAGSIFTQFWVGGLIGATAPLSPDKNLTPGLRGKHCLGFQRYKFGALN